MGSVGIGELVLIFLVVLLVFGAKRIPEVARGLGQGIREFRSASNEIARELTLEQKPRPAPRPPAVAPVPRTATDRAAAPGSDVSSELPDAAPFPDQDDAA